MPVIKSAKKENHAKRAGTEMRVIFFSPGKSREKKSINARIGINRMLIRRTNKDMIHRFESEVANRIRLAKKSAIEQQEIITCSCDQSDQTKYAHGDELQFAIQGSRTVS